MKKILIIFIVFLTFISCTKQERVRQFGGTMTMSLERGEKLIMATWKENDLFILTEPMDSDYTPKTKVFRESSSWSILESKIIFIEHK